MPIQAIACYASPYRLPLKLDYSICGNGAKQASGSTFLLCVYLTCHNFSVVYSFFYSICHLDDVTTDMVGYSSWLYSNPFSPVLLVRAVYYYWLTRAFCCEGTSTTALWPWRSRQSSRLSTTRSWVRSRAPPTQRMSSTTWLRRVVREVLGADGRCGAPPQQSISQGSSAL